MRNIIGVVLNLCVISVWAQSNGGGMMDTAILNKMPKVGKVTGTIIDSSNRKAIDYASVVLLRVLDSNVVSGVVSNENGEFVMENLPMGRYTLVVATVGYKKYKGKPFMILPRNPEIALGEIKLSPISLNISEVVVSGEKQALLNTIDKRVIDVGKSLINSGGTATEVLQNVPGVTVDIDGNVSLRGNANVIVLIDGKPSGITGSSRAAILQQLPAGSIDRIEIITNPGAKYDADGMAGIINIITKKDKMQGFNTNITLGMGTHDKFNAGLGINYRVKKLNLYANYNFRSEARFGDGHSERRNQYSNGGIDTIFYNNNISDNLNKSVSHVAKAGFDWYLNNSNTLGFSTTLNSRNETGVGTIDYIFLNALTETTAKTYRETNSTDKNISVDYALDYKRILKHKREFTTSATLSTNIRNSNAEYINYEKDILTNTFGILLLTQQNKTYTNFNVFTAQADYSIPLSENHKIETGLKTVNRLIQNNFDASNYDISKKEFENDTLFTQHYNYEEHIHAGYVQYTGLIKSVTVQAGLRGEWALISGKSLLSNTLFNFQYPGIYPSALAKYTYKKTNDFQVSYSRRVNRPDARQLLPIKNYEDAYNFQVGNPLLKPESINSFELSYYKTVKAHSFGTTLYYRHTVDMITRLRTLDTLTGIATGTFRNFSSSDNTGLEVIIKNTIMKAIQITTNINLYQNKVNGSNVDATLQSTAFNWNARTMIAGRLSKSFSFQISGMYMAPTKLPQGSFQGMSGIDLGGKYEFWGTKANITFNISDILNSRHFELYNFGTGFTSDNYRKRETRIGMITFNYKFGNTDQPVRKKNRADQGEPRMDDF